MAQTLLIGLGGTGSRVVNNVVRTLKANKKSINNGEIYCAVLDTNHSDNELIDQTGTGVPVIATSKPQRIRSYFDDFAHLHMEEWCPQSPEFLEQSMIDGASESRIKSRIAFMGAVESDSLDELENLLNDALLNNIDNKIRIMLVSSLSGGTGSGMFIQVALWLRKYFSRAEINLRGIFLLPDIFISTIDDIRNSKTTQVRHYCNAYAAIRELNAISMIKKNKALELSERITLGDLFDSENIPDPGKPVFDYAFFIDNKDSTGVALKSIDEYERMVAQLVYMQLFAPMKNNIVSEEDNTFLEFTKKDEPLYGSCGAATAHYPVKSVLKYCTYRAAKEALKSGWNKIDSEINALKEEKKQLEKDGIFTGEEIDVKTEFVRLFDEKTSVRDEEAGRDRFFLSIARDVKNVTRKKSDDKYVSVYSDKTEDFIKILNTKRIDPYVTKYGGAEAYAINVKSFVDADHTKEQLFNRIKTDNKGLENVIDEFDLKVDVYAEEIVNKVFPYSMGDVNVAIDSSVYGLLAKKNDEGKWTFVHPVAARYILYKLSDLLKKGCHNTNIDDYRNDAITGGDIQKQFDNKLTAAVEKTPEEYLKSKKRFGQKESAFLDEFEKRYAEFVNSKIGLCEKYEKEILRVKVYEKLGERVKGLIAYLESFFKNLGGIQEDLENTVKETATETEGTSGKTVYVCGNEYAKSKIFESLDFDSAYNDASINKSVIDAVYGSLCAEKRPNTEENKQYLNNGIINSFLENIIVVFKNSIVGNPDNKARIDFDIYTAICKEEDFGTKADEEEEKKSLLDNFDLDAEEFVEDNSAEQKHNRAFLYYKKKLLKMASPLLTYNKEKPDNDHGMVTTREKTFWGFHQALVKSNPNIGGQLGVNAETLANNSYSKNELNCYRAVYGLAAKYIPKFNELENGKYYTSYRAIVDEMVNKSNEENGEKALVQTPHLDKTWHTILPYISAEMKKADKDMFFHGLWLAIAYGILRTDKDGNIVIKRRIDSGFNTYIENDVFVKSKDKKLTKTDIIKLIDALRADKVFVNSDLAVAEERFAKELEELDTYVGTDVLKGLTVKKDDLNPIDMICRYNENPKHDKHITAALVGSLEQIALELAEKYNVTRTDDSLEASKFKICRRIYDSSKRTKGKEEVFGGWIEAFRQYKINATATTKTTETTESSDQ